MNEEDDFTRLIGDDVTPLNAQKRVALQKGDNKVDKRVRREAATENRLPETDPLSGEPKELVGPLDELSFKRSGVQHGVFRNLRLGRYNIEARLDLHRMTIDEARRQVYRFVKDCLGNEVRTALITHGKSEGRETPAVLKSCVNHWLPQIDDVLAFHTAQKHHGGYGATYVLLKKSPKKKLKSRELYAR